MIPMNPSASANHSVSSWLNPGIGLAHFLTLLYGGFVSIALIVFVGMLTGLVSLFALIIRRVAPGPMRAGLTTY